jgi:hypothetical protein
MYTPEFGEEKTRIGNIFLSKESGMCQELKFIMKTCQTARECNGFRLAPAFEENVVKADGVKEGRTSVVKSWDILGTKLDPSPRR